MQATVFIPILSVIALVLKSFFGVEVSEDTISKLADALVTITLAIISLVGILKTYHKKQDESKK